jgi:hypothetical protein
MKGASVFLLDSKAVISKAPGNYRRKRTIDQLTLADVVSMTEGGARLSSSEILGEGRFK